MKLITRINPSALKMAEPPLTWIGISELGIPVHQQLDEGEISRFPAHGVLAGHKRYPLERFATNLKEFLHIGRRIMDGEGVDIDALCGKKFGTLTKPAGDIFHE